jgi:hypothetical protein
MDSMTRGESCFGEEPGDAAPYHWQNEDVERRIFIVICHKFF